MMIVDTLGKLMSDTWLIFIVFSFYKYQKKGKYDGGRGEEREWIMESAWVKVLNTVSLRKIKVNNINNKLE